MAGKHGMDTTDRAPIVYLPDGTPVKVRLVAATCEGDVSGEGHYGYYPRDLGGEDPTVYFEDAPSVECVHCGDEVAQALIENHHTYEHPMKRWNPAFYPDVFEDSEHIQDADAEHATAEEIREWDEDHDEPHPVFDVEHRPERTSVERDAEQTIEVPLESFSFWQAQMAHASASATNNPDHNGDAIHRAHEQMREVLRSFHTDTEG